MINYKFGTILVNLLIIRNLPSLLYILTPYKFVHVVHLTNSVTKLNLGSNLSFKTSPVLLDNMLILSCFWSPEMLYMLCYAIEFLLNPENAYLIY